MKNICYVSECSQYVHGNSMCHMHYKRFRKHGTTDKNTFVPKNRLCTYENCGKKHDSHGYCANHARQFRKYGHVLTQEEKHLRHSNRMLGTARTKGLRWSLSEEKKHAGIRRNTGKTHFEKGYTPWNKGKKGLITAWNKGLSKYANPENQTNKQQRMAFRKVRNLVIARDNSICQICQTLTDYAQVDHIKSWSQYPELRFELSNCRTLCMPCHYYITYKRKLPEGNFWGHRSQTT